MYFLFKFTDSELRKVFFVLENFFSDIIANLILLKNY